MAASLCCAAAAASWHCCNVIRMCIAGWYKLHSVAAQTSCVSKWEKRVPDPERGKKHSSASLEGLSAVQQHCKQDFQSPTPNPSAAVLCAQSSGNTPASTQGHVAAAAWPFTGQPTGKTRPPLFICFLLSFRECKDQKEIGQVAQSIAIVGCRTSASLTKARKHVSWGRHFV